MFHSLKIFLSKPIWCKTFNSLVHDDIIRCHWTWWTLFEAMVCCQVMHIGVSKIIITGSDNGLSPGRRQAIIWTNAGILLIGPLGINFSEIWNKITTFSFKKIHLKMSSAYWLLFCLALSQLRNQSLHQDWKLHIQNYINEDLWYALEVCYFKPNFCV